MTKYGILLDSSNLHTNRQFLIGYEELKENGGILPPITEKAEIILKETSKSGIPRYIIYHKLIMAKIV